jgi:hypothetical protein
VTSRRLGQGPDPLSRETAFSSSVNARQESGMVTDGDEAGGPPPATQASSRAYSRHTIGLDVEPFEVEQHLGHRLFPPPPATTTTCKSTSTRRTTDSLTPPMADTSRPAPGAIPSRQPEANAGPSGSTHAPSMAPTMSDARARPDDPRAAARQRLAAAAAKPFKPATTVEV